MTIFVTTTFCKSRKAYMFCQFAEADEEEDALFPFRKS